MNRRDLMTGAIATAAAVSLPAIAAANESRPYRLFAGGQWFRGSVAGDASLVFSKRFDHEPNLMDVFIDLDHGVTYLRGWRAGDHIRWQYIAGDNIAWCHSTDGHDYPFGIIHTSKIVHASPN